MIQTVTTNKMCSKSAKRNNLLRR